MSVAVEVATYLAGQGLGLVLATSSGPAGANLYSCPIPEGAPHKAVGIVKSPVAERPIRGMAPSKTAPLLERPRLLIHVRDAPDQYLEAELLAERIKWELDHLADTTLSGVRYAYARVLGEPAWLEQQDTNDGVFLIEAEFFKERSTS